MLTGAFFLFFMKGLVLSAGLFLFPTTRDLLALSLLFDLAVLAVFYVTVLK